MGKTYQELYDGYLKADKNDVAKIAREKFSNIVEGIKHDSGDAQLAFNTAVLVFSTFVVMDEKLSNEEWALFNYIIQQDLPRDQVVQITKRAEDCKGAELINRLADKSPKFKQDVVVLGLCVCAIDGNIAPNEHALIKYYLD